MSEELLKAIALAFKINADEWIAQLKDGDDWLSEKEVSAKVAELITEKVTAAKMQSRKSGQGEQNAKVLKAVKASGFENPDNLQGDELVSAFIAWKDEQIIPPTGDTPVDQLDKEAIMKLPIVKTLILEAKQESGKGNEKLKADFEAYKSQVEQDKKLFEQERIWDISEKWIEQKAREAKVNLKVEGADISEQERIKSLVSIIKHSKKVGLNDKKEPIFLGDDGEQLKDEFGNPISFGDIVVSVAKPLYGISTQDPTHQGGNPPMNGIGNGKQDYTPTMRFANQEEYDNFRMNEADPGQRAEAGKSWQYQQNKAAGN